MGEEFEFLTTEDKAQLKSSIVNRDLNALKEVKEESIFVHQVLWTEAPAVDKQVHADEITKLQNELKDLNSDVPII